MTYPLLRYIRLMRYVLPHGSVIRFEHTISCVRANAAGKRTLTVWVNDAGTRDVPHPAQTRSRLIRVMALILVLAALSDLAYLRSLWIPLIADDYPADTPGTAIRASIRMAQAGRGSTLSLTQHLAGADSLDRTTLRRLGNGIPSEWLVPHVLNVLLIFGAGRWKPNRMARVVSCGCLLCGPALIWIGITLLPFCFLTYMPRIPSRHTYLPSAGLSLVVAAAFLALEQRTWLRRRWLPGAVANVGLWPSTRVGISKAGALITSALCAKQLARVPQTINVAQTDRVTEFMCSSGVSARSMSDANKTNSLHRGYWPFVRGFFGVITADRSSAAPGFSVPGLYTATDIASNKSRGAPAAPDAHPTRAAVPCALPESGRRAGSWRAGAQ